LREIATDKQTDRQRERQRKWSLTGRKTELSGRLTNMHMYKHMCSMVLAARDSLNEKGRERERVDKKGRRVAYFCQITL
jgi:hypothetical protein